MSNIAEGFARKGDRDFARFLDISRGSTVEVQSILYVAMDAGYIRREEFEKLYGIADEIVRLGTGDDLGALKAAAGTGYNVVLDALFGAPAEAALRTTAQAFP